MTRLVISIFTLLFLLALSCAGQQQGGNQQVMKYRVQTNSTNQNFIILHLSEAVLPLPATSPDPAEQQRYQEGFGKLARIVAGVRGVESFNGSTRYSINFSKGSAFDQDEVVKVVIEELRKVFAPGAKTVELPPFNEDPCSMRPAQPQQRKQVL